MVKIYVYIPRSFLVINVFNQGTTLCSPCRLWDPKTKCYNKKLYKILEANLSNGKKLCLYTT